MIDKSKFFMGIEEITFEDVKLSDINVPTRFRKDYGDIKSLADSIEMMGLFHPIGCFKINGKFELAYGGRRFKALTYLAENRNGNEKVSVRILPNNFKNDQESLTKVLKLIEFTENMQRSDFTISEQLAAKAELVNTLLDVYGKSIGHGSQSTTGITQAQIAKLLGESNGKLSQDLTMAKRIRSLPEETQKLLKGFKKKSDLSKLLKNVDKAGETITKIENLDNKKFSGKEKILEDSYIVGDFFDQQLEQVYDFAEIDPQYGVGFNMVSNIPTIEQSNYHEEDKKTYDDFLFRLLDKVYNALRPNTWAILWYGHEDIVYRQILKSKFQYSQYGLWLKGENVRNKNAERLMTCLTERFVVLKKGTPILNKKRNNVFEYKTLPSKKRIHPAERPLELMKDILETFTSIGSNILVPFAGSGKTIIAAYETEREARGFDLSELYFNKYRTIIADKKYY